VPNLKFVALSVLEIIGGTPKIWGVPGFANPPYSAKFLRAFVRVDPVNICLPSLKFVALPVPEIIGGTQKNLGSPMLHVLPNF